ncbi:MAG: helix-turn-helix domain-containing protein [Ruminococcus sp.]|nr:helix-turn-helix domain-containing protein [Ruminococcus sp.]
MFDLYNKIETLCKDKGITVTELCRETKISRSSLSELKQGRSKSLSASKISIIADYFGIPSDALTSDSVAFDIEPHALSDTSPICCPICNSETTNFKKTRSVDFNNEKSSGLALEFFCEEGHTFYLLIESYKGNTYTLLTDESCKALRTLDYDIENAPVPLESLFAEELNKKYRTLDGYGKKAVDDLLDTEAARCEEQRKARFITFTKCSIHKASAGTGFDLNDPDMWKSIQVKDSEEARRADFAVEVDGDSMETTYHDGEIVYIVLDRDVPVGDVGLFTYENKGYIKERGDGCLISHNPKYDDIKPRYGNIECVGRVIGVAELAE